MKVNVEAELDIKNAIINDLVQAQSDLQEEFRLLNERIDRIVQHHGMIDGRDPRREY